MSLTDMCCKTAKPKESLYKLFHSQGLYLEILPTGTKVWRMKYRFHGKEKRITIGQYPNVGLSEARKQREQFKEDISQSRDPALSRLEKKQLASFKLSQTFKSIALEWHEKNALVWNPRYAQTVKHRLEKYVFPHLGSYPIAELKPLSVLYCLQQIEKTAPEMARRVKQYCSQIFRYSIATSRAEFDITAGLECALKKFKYGDFAAIDIDALPDFLTKLNKYQYRLPRQTYLAIRLMLLTFVRTKELIEARWSEIDFEKKFWIIPAERMKCKREHIVSLATQTIEILKELQEMNGKRDFVIPSISRPRKPMSNGTILVALKRMGFNGKMTGHGFRSLALGILKVKLGYSHEVADRQLAHVAKSGVDRAYVRAKFLPQRILMMQKYSDYVDKI